MRVPAATVTLWPSMVRLPSGTRHHLADVALVPERVVFVLAVEVAERGVDDPAGRVAKAAQAAAVLQSVGDAAEAVELDLRPLVGQDALVHPHRPVAADAARRALAAGLVRVELQQPVRGADEPPGQNTFTLRPSGGPPARSMITCLNVAPSSTS